MTKSFSTTKTIRYHDIIGGMITTNDFHDIIGGYLFVLRIAVGKQFWNFVPSFGCQERSQSLRWWDVRRQVLGGLGDRGDWGDWGWGGIGRLDLHGFADELCFHLVDEFPKEKKMIRWSLRRRTPKVKTLWRRTCRILESFSERLHISTSKMGSGPTMTTAGRCREPSEPQDAAGLGDGRWVQKWGIAGIAGPG